MAEAQTRVEDYLDDQIQTAADLEDITALLSRVEEQQNLLQKQVRLLFCLLPMPYLLDASSQKPKLAESKLRGMPMIMQKLSSSKRWTSTASSKTSMNACNP
jgi:hypothetical protein